jgi:hypothetical protein
VASFELEAGVDPERGFNRLASVAILIGTVAAIVAGSTAWLIVTDPVSVANAVDSGEISPLVLQLADAIYSAIAGLLQYL